ncbi:cyclic nucleotide-binding domain-containing protein [Pseudomonas aeruginosa]|nr:cyclic nucleotide-binding domain-containing protein [Pseudomonas aeruginosa]EKU4831611.1 cyclic nucleotide-binding domain-containing protein [Pseudomonas aeruginosa]EKW2947357.1 cyclic nucleotide-binding domain-containing protein [Pseudomonas aeruginosa]
MLSTPSSLNSHARLFVSKSQSRSFKAKSYILQPGHPEAGSHLLVKGSAQLVIENDGREMILGLLKPGDYFGDLPFPIAVDGHLVSVQARSQCQVAFMSGADFQQMVLTTPEMLMDVCGQLNERLSAATRKVGDLAFLDITGRIVSVIQDLVHASFAVKASEGTVIPITRQDLGRLASCSRETAGRMLKLLEEQGLIICSGRNITVLKA